jgi:hypothetical protein
MRFHFTVQKNAERPPGVAGSEILLATDADLAGFRRLFGEHLEII